MTKTLLFTAPKTCGCTTITTNLALIDQMQNPQDRVGLIQMTAFPDIHHHLGIEALHNFSELKAFHTAKEWSPEVLEKITTQRGLSIIQAPTLSQWDSLDLNFFEDFLTLLKSQFDRIYVDYNPSIPDQFKAPLLEMISNQYLILSLDPISLEATQNYVKANQQRSKKMALIPNQIPKKNHRALNHIRTTLDLNILPPLPPDRSRAWHQLFEGVPIALQKGLLKKSLIKLSQEITKI